MQKTKLYLVVDADDDLTLVSAFVTPLNVFQLQRVRRWGRVVTQGKPDEIWEFKKVKR